jgi:hypothetical protein
MMVSDSEHIQIKNQLASYFLVVASYTQIDFSTYIGTMINEPNDTTCISMHVCRHKQRPMLDFERLGIENGNGIQHFISCSKL